MTAYDMGVEFYRRWAIRGVEIRRMHTRRTSDCVVSHMGRVLASRTDVLKRGKVIDTLYYLPALPSDLQEVCA